MQRLLSVQSDVGAEARACWMMMESIELYEV